MLQVVSMIDSTNQVCVIQHLVVERPSVPLLLPVFPQKLTNTLLPSTINYPQGPHLCPRWGHAVELAKLSLLLHRCCESLVWVATWTPCGLETGLLPPPPQPCTIQDVIRVARAMHASSKMTPTTFSTIVLLGLQIVCSCRPTHWQPPLPLRSNGPKSPKGGPREGERYIAMSI